MEECSCCQENCGECKPAKKSLKAVILVGGQTSSSDFSGANNSFWWSPALEQMIKDAQAMTDPAARIAKYDDMQAYIMSQAPYVTIWSPVMTTMASKNVGGFYLHPVYQLDPSNYWKK